LLERLLRTTDDLDTCELVTGILWNLSSAQVRRQLSTSDGLIVKFLLKFNLPEYYSICHSVTLDVSWRPCCTSHQTTKCGWRSFTVYGATVWNSLPLTMHYSVLCTPVDRAILQSLWISTIASPWQFRM